MVDHVAIKFLIDKLIIGHFRGCLPLNILCFLNYVL
jgi:hypothetical protein